MGEGKPGFCCRTPDLCERHREMVRQVKAQRLDFFELQVVADSAVPEGAVYVTALDILKARLREQMQADGMEFSKCADCGSVYPLNMRDPDTDEVWTDTTVCSPRCFNSYKAYLESESRG